MAKRTFAFVAVFTALLSVTLSVQADPLNYYWEGGTNHTNTNIFTSGNWIDDNGQTVTASLTTGPDFNANISTSYTKTLEFDNNDFGKIVTLNIGTEAGGTTATVQRTSGNNFVVANGKTLNAYTGGSFTYNYTKQFQTNGTINVSGGSFTIEKAENFRLANDNSTTLTISSGNLTVKCPAYIGVASYTGIINQTGGNATFNSDLDLGWGDGAVGQYNLTGGTLTTTGNAGLWTGNPTGVSTFTVNGGTANFNKADTSFTVGLGGTNSLANTFTLTTGTVNAAGAFVVQHGGQLKIQGGDFNANSVVVDTTTSGSISMTNGTLKTSAIDIGNGTFSQTGGTLTPKNNDGGMSITGDYTLGTNATLKPNGPISVSGTATLDGTIDLSVYTAKTVTAGDSFTLVSANTITMPDAKKTAIGNALPKTWVTTLSSTTLKTTYDNGDGKFYWRNLSEGDNNMYTAKNWVYGSENSADVVLGKYIGPNDNPHDFSQYTRNCYVYSTSNATSTNGVKIDWSDLGMASLTVGDGTGTRTAKMYSQAGSGTKFNVLTSLTVNKGGTVTMTSSTPTYISGMLSVNGGTYIADKAINIYDGGVLNLSSGGTINVSSEGITNTSGNYTINLSGGTLGTNGSSWSTALNATLAADSTTTFSPGEGETITWSGVLSGSGGVTKTGAGTLTLSGANTYSGTTTVNGGTLTVPDGGAIAGSDITVSSSAPATMTIESGATVTSNGAIYVGLDNGSDGTLNITGGTVNAYWLRPGRNASSKGTVNISGGVVTVSKPSSVSGYDESEIGNNGSGKITVSGSGKLTFTGTVRIANMGQAESFINIQDYGEVSVKSLYVGQRGTNLGSMTLSGHGKLTVTDQFHIGTSTSGSGTVTLKEYSSVLVSPDGAATTGSDSYIGNKSGTNTLDISGYATFTAKQIHDVFIAYQANTTGVVKVSGNSSFTLQPTRDIILGNNGTGKIEQTGGTVNLNPAGTVYMGNFGTGNGVINVSGGTFNVGSTIIAGTRGSATIDLSGTGTINADGKVVLAPGYETTSNTTITQTGGTFNANAGIFYGNYNNGRGTGVYNLSGGTLNTTSIKYGNSTPASASFVLSGTGVANIKGTWDTDTNTQTALGVLSVPTTVSGGTLNVDTISIPTGKELTISGGTVNLGEGGITADGAYTVTLSGGTLTTKGAADWSSALDATVSNTVTFQPSENQSITWSGAMSGTGAITKTGAGTVTLSGANTYTGLTTVSGGVLKLTGDAVVANGPVTVGDNGTLVYNVDGEPEPLTIGSTNKIFSTGQVIKTGEGTLKIYSDAEDMIDVQSLTVSSGRVDIKEYFNGKLIVDSEGTFSPGNSVGSLAIGDGTYGGGFILNEAGAELLMEIGGSAASANDVLIVEGDITLADGSVITLVNNSNLGLGESFTAILSAENSANLDVLGHIQTTDFTELKYVQINDANHGTVYAITGRTLNANEIPEPSTWALLILGAAGLLYWRKKKNA